MAAEVFLSAPAFVMTLGGDWRSAKGGTIHATKKGPRLELDGVFYRLDFAESINDEWHPVKLQVWTPESVRRTKKGGR